jgi:hypothetical protein
VRVVGGDGVGHLVERGEALGQPVGHERLDAVGAGRLHVGHDVDQDHAGGAAGAQLAGEQHRGQPAQ